MANKSVSKNPERALVYRILSVLITLLADFLSDYNMSVRYPINLRVPLFSCYVVEEKEKGIFFFSFYYKIIK